MLVRFTGGLAALVVACWLGLLVAGPFGFARLPQLHPVHAAPRSGDLAHLHARGHGRA